MEQILEEFRQKGMSEQNLQSLIGISGGDLRKFKRYAQRRLFDEPLAYIKGKVNFYGREFKIDRRVYVPNPETEKMVRLLLANLAKDSIVLDVGTGCGCIAITVAKERPDIKVYASDIDASALELAKENAKLYNVDIEFIESSYVDEIEIKPTHVISNLPYGDESYILGSINIKEFKHMPQLACFHPLGILNSYEELIKSIQSKKINPILYFETGKVSKKEVEKIIPQNLSFRYLPLKDYSITTIQF
jgi:release factor glutamine methyltransferase